MDAAVSYEIMDSAQARIDAGEDLETVLRFVFSRGYHYGLKQGHFDSTEEGRNG